MSVDDELPAIMRAHDGEAPTRVEMPALHTRRRPVGRWLPVAGSVAVVLAVGGVVLALRPDGGHGPATTAPPAGCPHRYERRQVGEQLPVPAAPTTTDPGARLVPQDTPSSVVVCAYLGDPVRNRQALTGARSVTAGLAEVPASLTFQPRATGGAACLDYLVPTDRLNFLVRLHYGPRTLWLTAPGDHCAAAARVHLRRGPRRPDRRPSWRAAADRQSLLAGHRTGSGTRPHPARNALRLPGQKPAAMP